MKRIVTIQDISCIGKCSLTVALPIISAAGVETAVIPTAVLSTHTAFKEGFTFRDLTDDIKPISAHWKREGFLFDAIYTGYLGSFEQLKIVSEFFDEYKNGSNIVIVDPAMADNGKLYPGFSKDFAHAMLNLCSKADVIVPNLTEACFMLNEEYIPSGYSEEYIKKILVNLTKAGAKYAVLTGMSFEEGKVGVMSYNSETGEFFSYFNEKYPVCFHGTGDIFASSLTGALMNDMNLKKSLTVAVDFTLECIKKTMVDDNRNWYGVNFEEAIPTYINLLGK